MAPKCRAAVLACICSSWIILLHLQLHSALTLRWRRQVLLTVTQNSVVYQVALSLYSSNSTPNGSCIYEREERFSFRLWHFLFLYLVLSAMTADNFVSAAIVQSDKLFWHPTRAVANCRYTSVIIDLVSPIYLYSCSRVKWCVTASVRMGIVSDFTYTSDKTVTFCPHLAFRGVFEFSTPFGSAKELQDLFVGFKVRYCLGAITIHDLTFCN